eukprot:2967760-Pyramimonas_sp.AAC.1
MFLGAGRNRRHTSGQGKGRRGSLKDANGKTMECDICHSTQHFRHECPQGDRRGRGPSIHLAQADSDMQYVDWDLFQLALPIAQQQLSTSWLPDISAP